MDELLKTVLSLSFSGTVVILFLYFLCRIFGKKMTKSWQYYLWLIAVLRLLVPVSGQINLVGNAFSELEISAVGQEAKETGPPSEAAENLSKGGTKETEWNDRAPVETGQMREVTFGFSLTADLLAKAAGMAWLTVACFLLFQKILAYRKFAGYIRAGSEPAELELLEQFGKLAEEKRVRGTVGLYVKEGMPSPFLMGCFFPKVILPSKEISETDFYYTALHELVHCRRLDLFYKWLIQLTVCLHWFNPFVWLMGRETDRFCELACDEAVLGGLMPEERRTYGDVLLRAASAAVDFCPDGMGVVTMQRGGKLLKGRLEAITEYKKRSGWMNLLSLILAVAAAGSGAVLGAYAKPETEAMRFSEGGCDFFLEDGTDVIERDQVIYILCDGLTEEDLFPAGVVDGTMILAAHRDYQVSVVLSKDRSHLLDEAEKICGEMQEKGTLSRQDAALILETAAELQRRTVSGQTAENVYYDFIQSIFYEDSYLFYVGYDLAEADVERYGGKELTLDDGEKLYVSFADTDQQWMEEETFLKALCTRLSKFRKNRGKRWAELERPIVSHVEYVGEDLERLAAEYDEEEEMGRFGAILLELEADKQEVYLEQAFVEDNIAVFSIAVSCMYRSNNLSEEQINAWALRAYEEGRTEIFANLLGYMDDQMKQEWYTKVQKEQGKQTSFSMMIESMR